MMQITETQLKKQVGDRLQYGMNQGKLYFDRLNSGEVIEVRGKTRRRVKLCREGTADFYILKKLHLMAGIISTRIIFLELKSVKGKQRSEQGAFQKLVEAVGGEYHIIRSIEDLEKALDL